MRVSFKNRLNCENGAGFIYSHFFSGVSE